MINSEQAVVTGMSEVVAANAFSVPLAKLRYPGRAARRVALARQVAIYLARAVVATSFGTLARSFGRDRATVIHAVRRVEAMRDDPQLGRMLGWLETTLGTALEKRP